MQIGRVCVVCVCVSVTKNTVFRRKDGLIAHTYATCRNTFVFMCVVVLETAVSAIYSATSYYPPRVIVIYAVFVRVLLCVITATPYSLCSSM